MSPRPAPTRHDETAQRFLAAAAQLIDAYLHAEPPGPEQSARLRHIRFPAALEWLRTEDVIRLAETNGSEGASRKAFFNEGASRKAFFNRWATRDEFLPDAMIYAFLRKYEADDPQEYAGQVPSAARQPASFSEAVISITDGLLFTLLRHPRSYLVLHLGPLLPQHPRLWEALLPAIRRDLQAWVEGYTFIVGELGLILRPEWTIERVSLVLQAMLDGFVLRYRIQPDEYTASRHNDASVFADAVIAFILGIVDWERTGTAGRVTLDELVAGGASRDSQVQDPPTTDC